MGKLVLGGGLSGISSAYYLLKHTSGANIRIIESSDRTGGWIKSDRQPSGVIFERGPRTIRPGGEAGANTLQLIEELNLESKIRPISADHPAAKYRMVFAKDRLNVLPYKFGNLFRKGKLFSSPIIMQLMNDLKTPKKAVKDESIHDFVSRRFSEEIADYLIGPMICGICAGNSKEISVNFLMEKFFDYEQKHGSISKGIVANVFKKSPPQTIKSELRNRAVKEKWNVYSFDGGCEVLSKEITDYLVSENVDIQLNKKCTKLELKEKKVIAHLENGEKADGEHVISTLPASSLGPLLQQEHPKLAELLNKINYVTVGVVNLNFEGKCLPQEAFGFLVAPKENLPILGCIFDSCCFPNPKNNTVLTVMMGGHWFNHYFGDNPSEDDLFKVAMSQVEDILRIKKQPIEYKVNILHECIPQYVVGFKENLGKIDNYITEHKLPLSLCGASYYGVGVNDVILSAKNAVNRLM